MAVNWKAKARAGEPVAVEMIRGVTGEDQEEWHPGEVHPATVMFAKWLVDQGKARLASARPKPAPTPAEEQDEDAAPVRTRGRRKR